MGRTVDEGVLPKDGAKEQSLTIIDNRTGKAIKVPIVNNSIPATAFKDLKAAPGPDEREEDECDNGLRVFDSGFQNTAVLRSTITFIDGERGILRYRGYPIEQLAEKSSFLEVSYLLLYGSLPTKKQFARFDSEVNSHTIVHTDISRLVSAFRYNAHPMSVMISGFAALGAFAPEVSTLPAQILSFRSKLAAL
ncbi:hypothetical protein EMMF5_004919 [Cystobasidiomycetes sp. EMM_F5]